MLDSTFSGVLLPDPLRPMIPRASPWLTSRSTSLSASSERVRLVTRATGTRAAAPAEVFQAEAKKLAAWLTAPEQQIKAFKAKGTFPSQVEALTSDDLLSQTNAFFNDAPTGQILADRAKAVTVAPFKGPNYFAINDAMQQALARVDVDKTDDPASSWAKFEEAVNTLG